MPGIYARYSFLRGARTLATPTTELKYTQTTFSYFNRMLLGPHYELQTDAIQVHLFLNSIILLKKINSNFISRKFIGNFAKVFERCFLQDIHNHDIRIEVMDFFNFGYDESIQYKGTSISMKIPQYLGLTSRFSDPNLKLVNQDVSGGVASTTHARFVYALRLHLETRLLDRIGTMKSADHIILDPEHEVMLAEIKSKHEIKPRNDVKGSSSNKTLPPCISHIMNKVDTEHYLSHMERILISTYMFSKLGYDEEWLIENVFCKLSDWSERITRYQLKSVKKLKTMNCDKLEANSMCRKSDDKLGLCGRIRNPYNY